MKSKNKNALVEGVVKFLKEKTTKFNSIIRNKSIGPQESEINIIIKSLTLVITLMIIYMALNTNHYFTIDHYDGSNTVNISSLSLEEIKEVLSKEQNFSLYYYLVHFLLNFSNKSEFSITLFQLLTWIFSILLFQKVIKKFVTDSLWQSIGLLIYVSTPTIAYYSYYPRMYGMVNLLVISLIYLIQKYLDKPRTFYIVATGISLLFLSLIHLSALFVILMITVNYLLISRKKIDKLLILTFFLYSMGLIYFQINQKTNPQEIYILRGLEYLSDVRYSFIYYVDLLFTGNKTSVSIIPLFVLAISVINLIKSNGFYDKKRIYLYLNLLFFILYSLTQRQFSNYRHYIFLVSPLLILIIEGLTGLSKKHKGFLAITVIVFYLTHCFIPLIYNYKIVAPIRYSLCKKIGELENEFIVTDYYSYNFVRYCNKKNTNILILYKNNVYFAKNFSDKEIIINQAIFGGTAHLSSLDIPLGNIDYSDNISIKGFLEEHELKTDLVYLINSTLPRKYLSQYEISVLKGCDLEEVWKNIIYIFNCE